MPDPYALSGSGLTAPANNGVAITPDDATDLATIPRGLWIGGAGDLAVILKGDTVAVTLVGVPAGTLLPIRAARVKVTGTTATSIVALW